MMFIICSLFWFCVFIVFFFKQKTAYEMRISDWSSDVCSSDLRIGKLDHHQALGRHTVIQKRLCDDAGAAAKFDNKTAVIVRNLPSHMACQIARAWADGTYDARFGAQLLQKQARCQVFKVVGHPPDLPKPENPMQHTTPSCSSLRYVNSRISTANVEM